MENLKDIERYGHLIKEEVLRPLTQKIIPGTLVYETPEPFHGALGYYSEIPQKSTPIYAYIVLEKGTTMQDVIRANQFVKEKVKSGYDAAYAYIDIQNENMDVIRLRHLDNFDQILEIQIAFGEAGLNFHKSTKKYETSLAVIRLKKLYHLFSPEEGLYFDVRDKEFAYFSIPNSYSWGDFHKLVERVRFNYDLLQTDVALGFFYTKDSIEEVVRVYNPEISLTYLKDVKNEFMKRL